MVAAVVAAVMAAVVAASGGQKIGMGAEVRGSSGVDWAEHEKLCVCPGPDWGAHDVGDHVCRVGPQFDRGARGARPVAVKKDQMVSDRPQKP